MNRSMHCMYIEYMICSYGRVATQVFAFTVGFGMHVTIWGGVGVFTGM